MKKFATTTNKEIVAGIFSDKESLGKAFLDLKKSGYSAEEINVVMSRDTKLQYFGKDENRLSFDGAKNTRLNLWNSDSGLVAAGPIISTLKSAYMSEKAAIRAALIGAGIPVEQATKCNDGLKNGKILLTVNPKNDDELEYISYKWNQYSAEEVYS